ncbi:MAG: CoA transferase [Dehalococcoidia bacterium]|nr:CoA transferase [Dehalococcoidia bacterium]
MPDALSDLRVIELAQFIAGPYAAKLLADLGADVIKVEPPRSGDVSRRHGPFPDDVPHPDRSGLFFYLNTNKRGLALDIATPTGASILGQLLRTADILITDHTSAEARRLGLTFSSLRRLNPRLIVTSITYFGWTGPYRSYRGSDLVAWQASGKGYYTPEGITDPERENPLKAGGHQADFMGGVNAAAATLSAVYQRWLTGKGQHVDQSVREAVATTFFAFPMNYFYGAPLPSRLTESAGAVGAAMGLIECSNGLLQLSMLADHQWQGFVKAMGEPEWTKDQRFRKGTSRARNWVALREYVEQWTKARTKEEVTRLAQAQRVPAMPVNNAADILASDHLRQRGSLVEFSYPQAGTVRLPGPAYKLSATPVTWRRPPPRLGEHTAEILGEMGYSRDDVVRLYRSGVV